MIYGYESMNSINPSHCTETGIMVDISTGPGPVYGIIEDGVVTMRDFNPVNAPPQCINPKDSIETRVLERKE